MKKLVSSLLFGEHVLRRIIGLGSLLASVILAIMMLLTVADVCLRGIFQRPIMGAYEISEYLMACVGTLGLGWCALKDGHISVDIITNKLSQRTQAFIKSINYILVIGLSALIAVQTFSQSMFERQLGIAGTMTHLPEYLFYLVVVIGYTFLFLAALILLLHPVSKEEKR